ncbi:hypothetical protein K501DRAFT_260310 [Backusella circina FSU 941]|nr:hypothetical protein K501DRAFT_260310 [Backusella circina FSU 941]
MDNMDTNNIDIDTEYDPSHKTTSVASNCSNTSSIWDPLPSLYSGRADSVASEPDEPLEELGSYEPVQPFVYENDQKGLADFLNSILQEQQEEPLPEESRGTKRKLELTEDQKRANHIASEQKRRNTIRGGFKDLTNIIPTLKNLSHSKSTILFKAVDYMKQLDRRNKGLKDHLHRLQQKVARKKMSASKQQQQQYNYHQHYSIQQLHQLQKLQQHHPLKLQQHQQQVYSYDSISIPANTPIASATTSPTLTASNVNNIHSSHIPALIMPASEDYMLPPVSTSLRDHIMNSRKCTS